MKETPEPPKQWLYSFFYVCNWFRLLGLATFGIQETTSTFHALLCPLSILVYRSKAAGVHLYIGIVYMNRPDLPNYTLAI